MIAEQAAAGDWGWLKDSSLIVAAIGLVGIMLSAWISAMLDRRTRGRERYAQMAATLAAWIELPFMIRRRTSNDRATVDDLVAHIQELQRQLTIDHAELRADCRWLAACRDEAKGAIQDAARPLITEAWATPPVSDTSQFSLGDWGNTSSRNSLEAFVDQVRWRFGWRRLASPGYRALRALRTRLDVG
jgi:hypothetical protein